MTADKLAQAQDILKGYPAILAAYLHGSTAAGNARPDSDVDIALLPHSGQHIPLKSRLECSGILESVFGCPVDIGELSTRNLVYAKEVIIGGQEILTLNRFQSDRFMATCLSMYSELQERWRWATSLPS